MTHDTLISWLMMIDTVNDFFIFCGNFLWSRDRGALNWLRHCSCPRFDGLPSVAISDLAGGSVGDGGSWHAARGADAVEQGVDQGPAGVIIRQLSSEEKVSTQI